MPKAFFKMSRCRVMNSSSRRSRAISSALVGSLNLKAPGPVCSPIETSLLQRFQLQTETPSSWLNCCADRLLVALDRPVAICSRTLRLFRSADRALACWFALDWPASQILFSSLIILGFATAYRPLAESLLHWKGVNDVSERLLTMYPVCTFDCGHAVGGCSGGTSWLSARL
jgi:hypothetical protein